MTAASMTSSVLETALREAIRDHANQHHRGQQDLAAILETLASLAGSYLAEIGAGRPGNNAFLAFGLLTANHIRRAQCIALGPSAMH